MEELERRLEALRQAEQANVQHQYSGMQMKRQDAKKD